MKSLFILLILVLGTSINAQTPTLTQIPNLTTEFSDLTDKIIQWEMEEGDIVLYKYSRYYELVPGTNEPEETQLPMYVKFFFNEERTQLRSFIIGFVKNDELYSLEYFINIEEQNLNQERLVDGNLVFNGKDERGNDFIFALISEKPSLSVYIGRTYSDGTYSMYVSALDNISRASFEDVIRNATQQDWDNRYNPD